MNKKIMQIISLIISILGLIYLILSYYGLIRYIKLHIVSTEHYISKYMSLPKATKDRVVISFETDKDGINKIKPFLNSILDQTVRVDDIGITISEPKDIPENLKKVLSVYSYDKDYDDAGNLICAVLREPDAKTKIIFVEPNMIYGEDFIQNLIEKSEKEKDKIIYVNKKNKECLIKPEFFNDNISDYKKGKGKCKWIEDCSTFDTIVIEYSSIYKRL